MIHLNYDGKQNNGIIFNDKYPNGALFVGAELKPTLSFEYDSFQYSEVFVDTLNYVEIGNIKRIMADTEATEIKHLAMSWTQQLGQEGNPNPEQLQEMSNNEAKQYLMSTDWYVTRKVETGEEIPADILGARAEARASIK